jgi:putative ABC transport system permease protein
LQEQHGVLDTYPVAQTTLNAFREDGDSVNCMIADDGARLAAFVTFRDRQSRDTISWDDSKIILSEKFATSNGLSVGDPVVFYDSDGNRGQFIIGGICESYIYNYAYIPAALYGDVFGKTPEASSVLAVVSPDLNLQKELSAELLKLDNVRGVSFSDWLKTSFSNMIKSIDYIVLVLIFSAAALAFIVLYNLTNINIAERQKEIATIKVLGFYDMEVSAYIFREITLLTLMGTALGLVGGIFLHRLVITTVEVDIVMFGRTIAPTSYVWSALLTLIFSVLVYLVMYRKLKRISMVESLKAPE